MTKITDATVKSLRLPAGKTDVIHFDSAVRGFGLRLRQSKPGGPVAQQWVFQYRSPLTGESKRITFGSPTTLGAKQAREEATRLRAETDLGRDPQAHREQEREAAQETYKAIAAQYLAKRQADVDAGKLARQTFKQINKSLTDHWAGLNRYPLRDITHGHIVKEMDKIKKQIAANRARTWLSSFYIWAMGRGIVTQNPVILTNRPAKEKARDRVLSDDETRAVWNATDDKGDFSLIVRLLILTGQRRDEVGGMRWDELELDGANGATWHLPAARVKNKRAHTVPLSPQVVAVLSKVERRDRRPYLFGSLANGSGYRGWSQAKKSLDARLAATWPKGAKSFAPWTLHDLRRTCASKLAELGTRLEVTEAALNHVGGSRGGIVGVYQKYTYDAEKRAALTTWGNYVDALVSGKPAANVLRMAGRAR